MSIKVEDPSPADKHSRFSVQLLNVLKYSFRHMAAVFATIVIGVWITVVISNRAGLLDRTVQVQVDQRVRAFSRTEMDPDRIAEQRRRLEAQEGLSLSFWPKHLRYTLSALQLDLGTVLDRRKFNAWVDSGPEILFTTDSRTIILSKLPATLLLSGTAFLFLALVGMPIALYLSQREGCWLDRLVGVLTPLSSVPAWVIGILLVLLFSVQLGLFPVGRMMENVPPQTAWETILTVAYHLILPAAAIVLSLIFQLVFHWRTYLLIYANEDYLILARAKGLKEPAIQFQYVLRPALPYIATHLALTLVGFWQMTTALEFFFQWPGIGKLLVDALPHFHFETMYPGEMTIIIGLVVLFAYLLGFTVLVLEFLYVVFDPRIRLGAGAGSAARELPGRAALRKSSARRPEKKAPRGPAAAQNDRRPARLADAYRSLRASLADAVQAGFTAVRDTLREVAQLPSGRVGLVLLSLLALVSILVLIFIPYDPVAKSWSSSGITWDPEVPKMALPLWVNWFRAKDLPPTIVLPGQVVGRQAAPDSAGMARVQMEFAFDYPYEEFPTELALYFTATRAGKKPFATLTWVTPDGREIDLKSGSVADKQVDRFTDAVPVSRIVRRNPQLKEWFAAPGGVTAPEHYLLFADPAAEGPVVVQGQYRLIVQGVLFEPDSDFSAKLVVFGSVGGWAGTDYQRRDLSIPLLWGIPFALFVGVFGAVTTSLVALILAAASAWLGGWVDYLLQRAIEINLVLPVLVISVLLYSYLQLTFWLIVGILILSTVLGSSVKSFRAAFLQEKASAYIEAAMAYGASDWRIITRYLARRIVPMLIPQLVLLIPSFIFLEATLAIFNIRDARYPTWGGILFSALRYGSLYGSRAWVLMPIALMLVTGLAFVLIGFALNRVLTPHLKHE